MLLHHVRFPPQECVECLIQVLEFSHRSAHIASFKSWRIGNIQQAAALSIALISRDVIPTAVVGLITQAVAGLDLLKHANTATRTHAFPTHGPWLSCVAAAVKRLSENSANHTAMIRSGAKTHL